MMKKNKLSVVIITHNEEAMIEGCLKSVAWADEIIIIDDYSEDKTLKIAKKYTKRVFKKRFKGFALQKNYGISKAKYGWILILDADERISSPLAKTINRLILENSNYCYNILFKNFFLGKEMEYGGWQNEYHIRLFKNKRAIYKNQEVHEVLKAKDEPLPIIDPIYHFSHRDISSNLLKTRQYAMVESGYNAKRGYPKVTKLSLLKNIINHFIYRYIKAKGYRDGMEGFIEATYQAFSQIFIIQAMTWERQRGKESTQLYKELDQKLEESNFSFQKKEVSHSNVMLRTMIKKINKYFLGYLFISLVFIFLIFKGLILNISTHLIDWRDYAYVIWVMNQAVESIREMSFSGLFNGNAFYPNEGILLFSDLLWPQALMTFFFSFFTKNIIAQFNLVFLSTLLLNTVSIYVFWKTIFKNHKNVFFASLVTNFSPYLFLEINHFQMISYWPFFFALHYLFKNKKTIRDLILLSLFLSIQFYAAVYWAIFLITAIGTYYLVSLLKKENIFNLIKNLLVIGALSIILVGPVFLKYSQVQKAYGVKREYHEYVNYSAHLTDYLFNGGFRSIVSQTEVFKKINSFNRHGSGEIAVSATMIVYFLSLLGIFTLKKSKNNLSIAFSLKKHDSIFLILTLIGFIFSLGPRLSVNGHYLAFPLPFAIALKYLVIFEPIRATSRFVALFYIGLTYFAIKGLSKINKSNNFIFMLAVLMLFFLEIIPTSFKTESNNYYPAVYNKISEQCGNGEVLLEYPFNQDTIEANIATNLKYKASQLTAAVNHNCNLVNGYAGFDPREYSDYITNFNISLKATNSATLNKIINQKDISFIKVNKKYMSDDKLKQLDNIDFYHEFGTIISENREFSLIEIREVGNE